eukprot:scaffold11373_cov51-Phaeocystis_antarctica.AAC.2
MLQSAVCPETALDRDNAPPCGFRPSRPPKQKPTRHAHAPLQRPGLLANGPPCHARARRHAAQRIDQLVAQRGRRPCRLSRHPDHPPEHRQGAARAARDDPLRRLGPRLAQLRQALQPRRPPRAPRRAGGAGLAPPVLLRGGGRPLVEPLAAGRRAHGRAARRRRRGRAADQARFLPAPGPAVDPNPDPNPGPNPGPNLTPNPGPNPNPDPNHQAQPSTRLVRASASYSLPAAVADDVLMVGELLQFPRIAAPITPPPTARLGFIVPDAASWPSSCTGCGANLLTPATLQKRYKLPATAGAHHPKNSMAVAEFQGQFFEEKDLETFSSSCSTPVDVATVVGAN